MNQIKTAEQLAKELGDRSQILKNYLVEEINLKNDELIKIYELFGSLINDLTVERFANIYSQTISYGLFFAATQDKKNELSRINAHLFIPNTIPILNKLFYFLTSNNLPKSISFIVDDIIQVLRNTTITSILYQFKTTHWTNDPVIHFYETFLLEFDPETRNKRGVFYTPTPVVSYIMKSLHQILKKSFKKNEGLAEKNLKILDIAAGSMTFLNSAINLCHEEYKIRGKNETFKDLVEDHILEDFFAFEILVAPYAIGHFKIFNTLENFGIIQTKRIKLFLTNALEIEENPEFSFLPSLNDENNHANKIKKDNSVLVICGNPPYESSSMNKSKFISKLMIDYKKDVSNEKNIQPLDNDYLKFIRFSHWKINQNGEGVIGMITSNSYLDGIIHRGMRKMLMDDFNQIYILNLHGSVRRNENSPEGKSDQNIFDIMQGVSIIFLIKTPIPTKSQVFYQDLWGTREEKYDFLSKNFINTTKWLELSPKSPNYFFAVLNEEEEYSNFVSVEDIFLESTTGVKTHRDKFIVSHKKETLLKKLENFSNISDISDEEIQSKFNVKETKSWKINTSRKKIFEEGINTNKIITYHYRPFDFRFTYYSPIMIDRPRGELMESISNSNPSIIITRQIANAPFHHVFVTEHISDINLISNSHGASFFPIFRKQNNSKISNISKEFILKWEQVIGITITNKDVFNYVYAILYSEEFRIKFIDSLLRDFPKIPIISNKEIFMEIVDLGKKLVDLHLLKKQSSKTISEFPVTGSNKISKISFDEQKFRVYINKEQYFTNISSSNWNFKIGSFNILKKWLDERKKSVLNLEGIKTFQNIVYLTEETKLLQNKIDSLFPSILKNVIKIDFESKNLDKF